MRTERPPIGFLGAPIATTPAEIDADVAILGVPHGMPYPDRGPAAGCSEAPAAIRERSLRHARFRGHWDFDIDGPLLPVDAARLVDAGDVPGDETDPGATTERVTDVVRAILAAGARPICLGGDDSVPIPILRAWDGRGPITVLQVDAHLDFRDEVQGVREGYSSPMRRASEMGHVDRIVQLGIRGVGSARASDVEDARRAGNVIVSARELRARGVPAVLAEALPANGAIVLSLDLDGLDPAIVPAVSAPAPGGIGWDEAVDIVRAVGPRLAGAVVTELVPALDVDGRSTLAAVRLVTLLAASMAPRARVG